MDVNLSLYLNGTEGPIEQIKTDGNKTIGVPQWYETGRIQIPLYAVIFMLAVIGNTLVILTLVSYNFFNFHVKNYI